MKKQCSKCRQIKALSAFHSQPSGKYGRHSYCATCANKLQRTMRIRHITPERRRANLLKSRYGLTPEKKAEIIETQGGVCAICRKPMKRPCVDHDHNAGNVRGVLCHRCNIRLGGWDDLEWRAQAMSYLAIGEEINEGA